MATQTTNYTLEKPGLADNVDITDINGNMDVIDKEIKKKDFDTLAEVVTSTDIAIGDKVFCYGNEVKGDELGGIYEIVAAATGTDDGYNFIDLTGITGQAKLIQKDVTDTGYTNGGFMEGKSSLLADYQYLAGDGFWYKLKHSTTSPYTHDTSDTPDATYLEKITSKTTEDRFKKYTLYDTITSSAGAVTLSDNWDNYEKIMIQGFNNTTGTGTDSDEIHRVFYTEYVTPADTTTTDGTGECLIYNLDGSNYLQGYFRDTNRNQIYISNVSGGCSIKKIIGINKL